MTLPPAFKLATVLRYYSRPDDASINCDGKSSHKRQGNKEELRDSPETRDLAETSGTRTSSAGGGWHLDPIASECQLTNIHTGGKRTRQTGSQTKAPGIQGSRPRLGLAVSTEGEGADHPSMLDEKQCGLQWLRSWRNGTSLTLDYTELGRERKLKPLPGRKPRYWEQDSQYI